MNINDLRELLEKSSNKFAIFEDLQLLKQCKIDTSDLLRLIDDFLTDSEKAKLFELSHFRTINCRGRILKLITDNLVILRLLDDDEKISLFQSYDINDLIYSLESSTKLHLLYNIEFWKKRIINPYDIFKIIETLSDRDKQVLLDDRSLLEKKLELTQYQITDIIAGLQSEEAKLDIIDTYGYTGYQRTDILKTLSDASKTNIILAERYSFDRNEIIALVSSMSVDWLAIFFQNNKDYLSNRNIKPYNVIQNIFDSEKRR